MAAKKATAKAKGTAKKAALKKPMAKVTGTRKLPALKGPLAKSGILKALSEYTGLAKKETVSFMEAQGELIGHHIKSRGGVGTFTLPGLLKITVVKKPARPARKGINPFTGEETMFKAKPAHKVVKIKALKALKNMVD